MTLYGFDNESQQNLNDYLGSGNVPDLQVNGPIGASGDISLPSGNKIASGNDGNLFFGGQTPGPVVQLDQDPMSFVVFDNTNNIKLLETQTGNNSTSLRPGIKNPGTPSNPILKLGNSGAGIFMASGEVKVVDAAGNVSTIS